MELKEEQAEADKRVCPECGREMVVVDGQQSCGCGSAESAGCGCGGACGCGGHC
ncbi:hypothetical protein M1329_00895 [Candidatus Marsarchaeota archaeon]|nr:hypothetical protein [Candidatus Marsarchaeota archaeon]MCL5099616.1 hypothetical protein [Candidatus Marsarchaeota archaeon]